MHSLFLIAMSIASVMSFLVAALLIRAARRLNKRAKAGQLMASLIAFADSDFQDMFQAMAQRGSPHRAGLNRAISRHGTFDRYLAALILIIVGSFAAFLAVRGLVG